MDGQRARRASTEAASKDEAAMDAYLSSRGLHRKRVAKDGSCLFRAVAEQVLHSQARHLEVRKSCINFLRKNRSQFEAFIEGSFDEYLKCLENPQEWVGQVEISALSQMYRKEFVIYQEPGVAPSQVTDNGFSEKIMLCFSNGNHYDLIYPTGFVENAALCQSIIYELLYEKVFGINVTKQMSEIKALDVKEEVYDSGASDSEIEDNEAWDNNLNPNFADMNGMKSHHNGKLPQVKKGLSEMPARVLRSLSPAVYRNVEYEVWLKSQRDQQKRDFSIAACMQFSVGDKCKVRLDSSGVLYNAHIQEVVSENGPAVVFVEEFGKKHSVPLKNIKPVPLTISNTDGWNTVSGRKIKKSSSGVPVVQFEKDYRGQKSFAKQVKTQTAPSRQQVMASKQQGLPSDQSPTESKGRSRTPPKVPGRKQDWERSEESSYYKREGGHFGLTPEERREKQVFEESKSLYEMQNMDTAAFPELSASVADTTASSSEVKRNSTQNKEKIARRKSEDDDQRMKDPKSTPLVTMEDKKTTEGTKPPITSEDVVIVHDVPVHNPAEQLTSTAVPSQPSAATPWPGVLAPVPGTGSGSTILHPQETPFSSLQVPSVGQPMLPMPQTLNPYHDSLYPGFPVNEKGERITSPPPYSYCKNGSDLPNDKSILHFFYNLGIKAYTCPMCPPHLYLHPLHQAYLHFCRMYPNIHVYSQNNWMPEPTLNQTEANTSVLVQPNELRSDNQGPHPLCSPVPPPQSAVTGAVSSQTHEFEGKNDFHPEVHEFESSESSKTMYPNQFGQGPYVGPLPVVPPLYSQMWYGYPYPGYMESPVVQHNVFIPPQDSSVPNNILPGTFVESIDGTIVQPQELANTCKPDKPLFPATVATGDCRSNTFSVKDKNELVCQISTETVTEPKMTTTNIPEEKRSMENESGNLTIATENLSEEKRQRAKEESSEDEREVSHMLSSGRSKNFYNQSYGSRRSRNERFYQPNRGGYQYSRNEESWRGARSREDAYSHSRSTRGRPNRRRPFGEPYRQQHD